MSAERFVASSETDEIWPGDPARRGGTNLSRGVVYAPPTRPTICFEPYTCPTDALNLAAGGLDVGLIVLAPGERWSDWIELRLDVSA